jgi:peptide/nickel transport system substrate-binding protein
MRLRLVLAALALLAAALPALAQAPPSLPKLQETPALRADVQAGRLPPIAERLPRNPVVVTRFAGKDGPGRSGGEMAMLMAVPRDIRMMVVYGYARLVGYDEGYRLLPDLLEGVAVEGGRRFTMKLRAGHRWSDGTPFTAEDFRYYWEDVANDADLSPAGPPSELLVNGKPPRVEIIDATTIRYTWDAPNPHFLAAQARAAPLLIFRPSRYLKSFHRKYAPVEELERRVRESRQGTWQRLHNRQDDMYRNDNVDLPTLQPWMLATRPPSQRFVFVRNPYYHRVDANGVQLPYIDRVVMNIVSGSMIALKTGAGDTDLQARYVRFDNYTFLRQGAKQFDYDVRLWDTAGGAQLAIYPNLNHNEPVWRGLMREPRFRRALSLAIDRPEINEILYVGLGQPGNNTVRPLSPLFREEYRTANAHFDAGAANRLLDELGLAKRNGQGLRLLPDGRPMVIVLETAGESTEETDVLHLVADTWKRIGIKLVGKPQTREILRQRIYSGEAMMTIWGGLENGLARPESNPAELACLSQSQLWCPKWGQYRETRGKSGEPVDVEDVRRLNALTEEWEKTLDPERQEAIWREMLELHARYQYTIGIVSGVQQPVVVGRRMRNVPERGVHSWEPGAFFGIYRPDTFWLAEG